MSALLDHIALLLRAIRLMPELQALLLGLGAFLTGLACGRMARRFRLHPTRLLRGAGQRLRSSDHRHAAIHMHRGAGQITRLR